MRFHHSEKPQCFGTSGNKHHISHFGSSNVEQAAPMNELLAHGRFEVNHDRVKESTEHNRLARLNLIGFALPGRKKICEGNPVENLVQKVYR